MSITRFAPTKILNISVAAWYSLMIFKESASWANDRDVRVLESNPILWLTSWALCRRKHNYDCFWLWTVLPNHQHSWLKRSSNQLTYTTKMTTVMRLKQLEDQSHAWWHFHWHPTLGHSLGHDIFIVNNHDIFVIYLAWGFKQQNEHAFSLCPPISPMTIEMITNWKYTMSSSMWWSHQLFEARHWSSQ